MIIVSLSEVRDINEKIDKQLEFYRTRVEKLELRLSITQQELDQTLELIEILENERNK